MTKPLQAWQSNYTVIMLNKVLIWTVAWARHWFKKPPQSHWENSVLNFWHRILTQAQNELGNDSVVNSWCDLAKRQSNKNSVFVKTLWGFQLSSTMLQYVTWNKQLLGSQGSQHLTPVVSLEVSYSAIWHDYFQLASKLSLPKIAQFMGALTAGEDCWCGQLWQWKGVGGGWFQAPFSDSKHFV